MNKYYKDSSWDSHCCSAHATCVAINL